MKDTSIVGVDIYKRTTDGTTYDDLKPIFKNDFKIKDYERIEGEEIDELTKVGEMRRSLIDKYKDVNVPKKWPIYKILALYLILLLIIIVPIVILS